MDMMHIVYGKSEEAWEAQGKEDESVMVPSILVDKEEETVQTLDNTLATKTENNSNYNKDMVVTRENQKNMVQVQSTYLYLHEAMLFMLQWRALIQVLNAPLQNFLSIQVWTDILMQDVYLHISLNYQQIWHFQDIHVKDASFYTLDDKWTMKLILLLVSAKILKNRFVY